MNIFIPTAEFCYGREKIIDNIINHSISDGITFLFGGRQSGKTTILLRAEKTLIDRINSDPSSLDIIIPVYVNLLRLPHNPTPENFFQLVSHETLGSCRKIFNGFSLEFPVPDSYARDSLKTFEEELSMLVNYFVEKEVNFLFLFDESKKIFKDNYLSGLNDNLFYAFYVSEKISRSISAVFCGSQELYNLIEDEGTSPLGSRANLEYVTNLSKNVLEDMVSRNLKFYTADDQNQFINELFKSSGGHAGICAYIVKRCLQEKTNVSMEALIKNFLSGHSQLFNIWLRSLSPEAVTVHNELIQNSILDINDVPKILHKNKLNSIYSDWAVKQILFTGIGYPENEKIKLNYLYENYMKNTEKTVEGIYDNRDANKNIPNELVTSLRSGDLIIFCGAGLSVGAGLPDWIDFVAPLANEIGSNLPPEKDHINALHLLDALQAYERINGTNLLITRLRAAVDTNEKYPTLVHQKLASIKNIKRVFTTNYDDLLERPFKDAGKKINKIIVKENIPFMDNERVQIIKICGEPENPETLVLTRSQFNFIFTSHTKIINLLRDSLEEGPILFMGYSMKDPFFSQVWDTIGYEFENFRHKGYVVMFNCSTSEMQELEDRNLKVINISIANNGDKTIALNNWLDEFIKLV